MELVIRTKRTVLAPLLKRTKILPVEKLKKDVTTALDRLLGENSELNELWNENEELYPMWKNLIVQLKKRLR